MKTSYIRVPWLMCAATMVIAILAGLPRSIGAQTQAAPSAQDEGRGNQDVARRAEETGHAAPAPQQQTPEQLRQKLQQLEQTVQELKAQTILLVESQQTVEAPAVL